jgi:hypothetical protein
MGFDRRVAPLAGITRNSFMEKEFCEQCPSIFEGTLGLPRKIL